MKKPTSPDLLLSRFTPVPEAFAGMKIAMLKMPYVSALQEFSKWLETYVARQQGVNDDSVSRKLPYRLLNSALVACAPTLAHAFEWYSGKEIKGFHMLAVAKADAPLVYPTANQVASVMRQWIRVWHDHSAWLQQAVATTEGYEEWQTLITTMREAPDTDWRTDYDPLDLFQQGTPEEGLAYDIIPNLLVTLLQDTESVIRGHTVRWRRMQEGGKHLCLLSNPIPVSITRTTEERDSEGNWTKKTESHNTFFCYRVELRRHTQAGRETPWIFVKTHCTRIAHHPLVRNERGTELTILVGTNKSRLNGWDRDSTLVRLKASKNVAASQWLYNLPELLAELKAEPLISPKDICANPRTHWAGSDNGLPEDEYYVLHTEGYKYSEDGKRRSGHVVLSGLPLPEQAEIISALTCGPLSTVLKPATTLTPEAFSLEKATEPAVLRDIEELCKYWGDSKAGSSRATPEREEARRQYRVRWHPEILKAIQLGTRSRRLIIPCFHSNQHTLDWIQRGVWRESLLLSDVDEKPDNIVFLSIPIPADRADLVRPYPIEAEAKPPRGQDIANWREELRQRWSDFIEETLAEYIAEPDTLISAVVELDRANSPETFKKKNLPVAAGAHGIVREAFARKSMRVQMTYPFRKPAGNDRIDSGQKGKAQNVAQEVLTRQLGVVFGPPTELYQAVGIDNFGLPVSSDLDVIAFSFRSSHSGIRYCLATRLRADGHVDVLLPGKDQDWFSYADACARLGLLFAQSRKSFVSRKDSCPLQLKFWDATAFVQTVLTQRLERPTIALLEAENWRMKREGGGGWAQLANPTLAANRDALIFPDFKQEVRYERADVAHLLSVIRLRTDDETPSYATNRNKWQFDSTLPMPNYKNISGFVDEAPGIFHYLSINGVAKTNKNQPQYDPKKPFLYKIDGSEHTFKHAPVIEMVPFCVAEAFDNPEGLKALCRIPHYLRVHPGWGIGEINSPYPLHLGDTLIKDQETILGVD